MLDRFRRFISGLGSRSADRATTAPLSDKQVASILQETESRLEIQQLIAATGQSVGKQREHNEDSILSITATMGGLHSHVPFGLYIVADGMGGHDFGEVASNATVRIIAGQILRKFHSYLFALPTQQPEESLQEIMEEAIQEAHRTVQRDAPGSGTTVTAALVLGQQVTVGHVGDSRLYSIRPSGSVEQLTHDHSLVRRLEELGHLNKEEAAVYPHRNVLIRAVGQGDSVEADIFTVPFPQGCTLMLCTDGLWGVIQDEAFHQALRDAPTLQRAC
ncbi:MAG TPA: protein phosphatase 2C domain-containing protein, partial [Anaerolineales bacterium]|nr:protein phosphatase 2C domain-containing protein [Anaerolineales bacterium]